MYISSLIQSSLIKLLALLAKLGLRKVQNGVCTTKVHGVGLPYCLIIYKKLPYFTKNRSPVHVDIVFKHLLHCL